MIEVMLAGGLAVAINVYILVLKYKRERYLDLAIDAMVSTGLLWTMSGTLTGLGVAVVGSSVFSIFLFFTPGLTSKRDEDEFKFV